MNFGDLRARVYPLLQDKLQKTWLNPVAASAVEKAIRKVANKIGHDEARITASLVQGQQQYDLPAGIRRLSSVKIIPENGSEPPRFALPEVRLDCIPITVPAERDPDRYSLTLTGSATENRYSLFFWPAPARSASDAIIVTYQVDTVITSNDPADAGDDAQPIPFPDQFEEAIVYYTAAFMLFERADSKDIEQGVVFKKVADQEIRENAPVGAISSYQDNNRAFP